MRAGEPGWVRAGYATYASHAFVARANIVLIDLRDREQDAGGRIPRSVSIPLALLEQLPDRIPPAAPIVLYGANDRQARQGLAILRRRGFRKVSLVEGNLEGWIRAGGSVVRGQPRTRICWKREPAAGEISAADFKKAMAARADTMLLDVRTDEEIKAGTMPGALHIPLDQLAARIHELPEETTILIYSARGPRAEMARRILAGKGIRCLYLAARVRCAKNRCVIEQEESAGCSGQ